MCSHPNSHVSGELPSASAALNLKPQRQLKAEVAMWPCSAPPAQTLGRSARVGLRLSLAEAGEQTPSRAVENLLVSFSFGSSEAAEESSRLDLVYFTLKKKRKDAGAILYLKEPQTSEEKKS